MPIKVAVIGGGPAGLVTLKHLVEAHKYFPIEPIQAQLFEAEDEIGGTFRYRVYEDAELVSSKYLTAFSDFRFPKEATDFLTPAEYVKYLVGYCHEFMLFPYIKCSSKVVQIRRNDGGVHILTVDTPDDPYEETFDAVAICSGLNVEPMIPNIPGLDKVPIVIHSSEFKSREQLLSSDVSNPTVVVLGTGETGMDIGHLAITTPKIGSVVMCHRDGFYCAPKRVPEPVVCSFWGKEKRQPSKPIDTSIASLFDTAYVHPDLQKGMGLWNYYTWSINFLLWLATGSYGGMDQWVGNMSGERMSTDSIILCKSDRAMPYISTPYRKPSLLNRIRAAIVNMPIKDTYGRHIELAPWPKLVDNNGHMQFEDTGRPESDKMKTMVVMPDVVILATGYTCRFHFLDDTYPKPATCDVRGIWKHDDISTAFIGFARPSIGAIPPLAELQAQLWVYRLVLFRRGRWADIPLDPNYGRPYKEELDPNALRPYELDYALHARAGRDLHKERLGVDHESYAYQLALDMGAAPTFGFVARQGFKVAWTWSMGSNFNTKFRLVGPWKQTDMALGIMQGELWDVTKRLAGVPFFVIYTLVPFVVFGVMSLCLYARDWAKEKGVNVLRAVRFCYD